MPVFIFNKQVTKIYIYDFFAGKGFDIDGYPGSPVLLFEEAKGKDCSVCNSLNGKEIVFAFNDKDNSDCLEKAVSQYVSNCQLSFCKKNSCNFQIYYGNHSFKDAFNGEKVQKILNQPDYAKFILLDQFGFKEVEEDIFIKLTKAPKTDFIFFIASSFIDRFKQHPAVKKYFDTSQIEFDNVQPKERHRLIANYFKRLIDNREYYIHHFTIKKGGNYYGLIFGSGHTYGMEKFLKVCWQKDPYAGESLENIYNDFGQGTLFHNTDTSNKKERVRDLIKTKLVTGEIDNNIDGLKFSMNQGCMPSLFVEVVKKLDGKRIRRIGIPNNQGTRIHDAKRYEIEILKT